MAGTLDTIVRELGQAYGALATLTDTGAFNDLLRELGIDDPPDLSGDAQFSGEISDVASAAADLVPQTEALAFAIEQDDLSGALTATGQVLAGVAAVAGALDALAADLPRVSAGTPNAAELAALSATFTTDTVSNILAAYMDFAHPLGAAIFRLFGVLRRQTVTLTVDGKADEFVRRKLVYSMVPRMLSNPVGALEDAYDWGQADFDATTFLQNVSNLLEVLGPLTGGLGNDDSALTGGGDDIPGLPPTLEIFNVTLGKSPDAPPGLQAILYVDVGTDQKIVLAQLTDTWQFALSLGGTYQESLVAKLLPPASLSVLPPSGSFQGHLGIQFEGTGAGSDGRVSLFSITSGCVLDAKAVTVGLEADLVWNGQTAATADIGFMMRVDGGRLLVKSDDGGLMSTLLGSGGADVKFDATVRWTPATGLSFDGAAGLDLSIPVNRSVGPIEIGAVGLDVLIDPSKTSAAAVIDGLVNIGPVALTVQKIGVRFAIDLTRRGSLGNADLGIDFQPPTGLGVAVDAGPVSGGGFISFDPANARYFGALELSVYGVAVKAFGIIETKFPDGHQGYSFLIIISAELTPIQLGLGFTLNGVGGLAGINRTIDTDGLLATVKRGDLDNVLFPHDVVDNAPAILHDLETLFPAAAGHYVFGPMAKIGWGTPTLVDAELGLVLELPGPRLAVLGTVHAALPTRDEAIVELNLDVAGVLDFPKKSFSLDASLHDSRVGDFPVSGDMSMRLAWGNNPNFALAIGGFNPHFNPPPGFPSLRPVSVDLGIHGNPSINLSGYLALTSNTTQVGAKLEARVSKYGAELYGFISFDALFVFSPFAFVADVEGGVGVKFHGHGFSLHFHGTISGPSPWHLDGQVCVSILFWDACVGFSVTVGGSSKPTLPGLDPWVGSAIKADGTQDVPGLQPALQNPANWGGNPVPGSFAVVTLISAPEGTPPPVDPLGSATVRQKAVPLDTAINRFAGTKPSVARTFDIQSVTIGQAGQTGTTTVTEPTRVSDYFAPAQFQNMSDADRLSSASFVNLPAGFTIASDAVSFGASASAGLVYDTIVFNTDGSESEFPQQYNPTQAHVTAVTGRSAVALGGIRGAALARFVDPTAAPLVTLLNEAYVLAQIATLHVAPGFTVASPVPRPTAFSALQAAATTTPTALQTLQVTPFFTARP